MWKLETHAHTKEVSPCGQVYGDDLVDLYHQGGYSGLVITDHYFDGFFQSLERKMPDSDWTKQVDCYLRGTERAKEAARKKGMQVYQGMELRFAGSPNDYLVFGVTRSFLLAHPRLDRFSPAAMRELCDREGLLLFQAHPFRVGLTRAEPSLLDGVEVYNAHPRQVSHNELALAYAREHSLRFLSGSDCHEVSHACRSGITCSVLPENERELVSLLRRGEYELIVPQGFLSV